MRLYRELILNRVLVLAVLTSLAIVQEAKAQEARAQEARVVLRSTVVGNQEQPKVLYIVPWQQAGTPELIYQPVQSLVDGVFKEIDRDEFLRELSYQQKINRSLGTGQ